MDHSNCHCVFFGWILADIQEEKSSQSARCHFSKPMSQCNQSAMQEFFYVIIKASQPHTVVAREQRI